MRVLKINKRVKHSRQKKRAKAIVLLSGGIDSAVALAIAKKKGFFTEALVLDYGQRHKKEIKSALRIAKSMGSRCTVLKFIFPWKNSSLLDKNKKIPKSRSFKKIALSIPSTYVPARNLIFLSLALSFAESEKAKAIFIGAHSEDYSGYPDCRKEFFDSFKKTAYVGTKYGKNIQIHTPLLGMNKKEIINFGIRLKVPLQFTWSCYMGDKKPCLACDSCLFRARAFGELGLKDPAYAAS